MWLCLPFYSKSETSAANCSEHCKILASDFLVFKKIYFSSDYFSVLKVTSVGTNTEWGKKIETQPEMDEEKPFQVCFIDY